MSKYNLSVEGVSVEAVFNKLGGVEGARRFLRGELVLAEAVSKWREENGVIYFSVISDGATGPEWIDRLESKGCRVGEAKSILGSRNFKPTSGVKTEVAVLKGVLFDNLNRDTNTILAEASRRRLSMPNAEVACLIRQKFSNDELELMGLWYIVVMHESVKMFGGGRSLLNVNIDSDGNWLGLSSDEPGHVWLQSRGFAFAVSETPS